MMRYRLGSDAAGVAQGVRREFETLFLDMMMKSMRSAAPGNSVLDSEGSRVFTGLLDHEFSRKLADQGGLGLADLLIKQLSKLVPNAVEDVGAAVKKSLNLPIKHS